MSKEKYKSLVAVILILTRKTKDNGIEILLQKRCNTGYADGMYDLSASGHLEDKELLKAAVIREAKEEIGIDINEKDLQFSSVLHCIYSEETSFINFYFTTDTFSGEIEIGEPNKCSELKWIDINELPDNIMSQRINALDNFIKSIDYGEKDYR